MTDISWWTYIWAIGLGILPSTILLSVFGASLLKLTGSIGLWVSIGTAVAAVWWLTRRHKQRHKSANISEDPR